MTAGDAYQTCECCVDINANKLTNLFLVSYEEFSAIRVISGVDASSFNKISSEINYHVRIFVKYTEGTKRR